MEEPLHPGETEFSLSEQGPTGVRLAFPDGTKVGCDLTRAPELDRQTRKGAVAYWRAVPSQDIDPALSYKVEFDTMPSMTGFKVDLGQDGDLMSAMDLNLPPAES